jgi:hypothetical protein
MNREILSAYFSSALRRGWDPLQQQQDERMHVPANPENISDCRISWCGETKNVIRGGWVLGWLGHLRCFLGPNSRSRHVQRQFILIHFSYAYCTTHNQRFFNIRLLRVLVTVVAEISRAAMIRICVTGQGNSFTRLFQSSFNYLFTTDSYIQKGSSHPPLCIKTSPEKERSRGIPQPSTQAVSENQRQTAPSFQPL